MNLGMVKGLCDVCVIYISKGIKCVVSHLLISIFHLNSVR